MVATIDELSDFRWGIERETHRIRPDGTISAADHPESLRAPAFTKDFAESQLELVTSPHRGISGVLGELAALTKTAHRELGEERFWPFSMPPELGDDSAIVTARKGDDDAGRLAERYRNGLIRRYGAARQMICGVHVNVSFGPALLARLQKAAPLTGEEAGQKSANDGYYLRLARNIIDDLPLLAVLFGASPVTGSSGPLDSGSAEPAFSYRNSPHGYARTEYRPFFTLESVSAYLDGIRRGMRTESDAFRRMGLMSGGRTIQLNDRVFQREKEFYAPIKFRRTAGSIAAEGIEYLELRYFDVDPFTPLGISRDALLLTHLLLLDGLTRASKRRTNAELTRILERADGEALRNPLVEPEGNRRYAASGRLGTLAAFARRLGPEYGRALGSYARRFSHAGQSAAARLAAEFRESGLSWTAYGASVADRYRKGVLDGNE